jgi:hypothetical protein
MVAVVETLDEKAQIALQTFLENIKGVKVKWFDDKAKKSDLEDEILYQMMIEEPKEYVSIDLVKEKLKQKINDRSSNEQVL